MWVLMMDVYWMFISRPRPVCWTVCLLVGTCVFEWLVNWLVGFQFTFCSIPLSRMIWRDGKQNTTATHSLPFHHSINPSQYLSMVLIDKPTLRHLSIKPRSHLLSCLKPFIWVTGCMRRVQIQTGHKEKNVISPASYCPVFFLVDRHPQPPVAVRPEDPYQPSRLPTCTIQPRWKWPSMTCIFFPVFGEFGSIALAFNSFPQEAHGWRNNTFLPVDTKKPSVPDRPELDLDGACKHTHTWVK